MGGVKKEKKIANEVKQWWCQKIAKFLNFSFNLWFFCKKSYLIKSNTINIRVNTFLFDHANKGLKIYFNPQ